MQPPFRIVVRRPGRPDRQEIIGRTMDSRVFRAISYRTIAVTSIMAYDSANIESIVMTGRFNHPLQTAVATLGEPSGDHR